MNKLEEVVSRLRERLHLLSSPALLGDVTYSYADLFDVSEMMVNATRSALRCCLLELLHDEKTLFRTLIDWSRSKTVCLEFEFREDITYKRSETISTNLSTEHERASGFRAILPPSLNITQQQYIWETKYSYKLSVYRGTDYDGSILLYKDERKLERRTISKSCPGPAVTAHDPSRMYIESYLQQFDEHGILTEAKIQPEREKFCTPCRNILVLEESDFCNQLFKWSTEVLGYLTKSKETSDCVFSVSPEDISLYLPALPVVFLNGSESNVGESYKVMIDDYNLQFQEKLREMCNYASTPRAGLDRFFVMLFVVSQLKAISHTYVNHVNYVEEVHRKQIFAALGKELSLSDITACMRDIYKRKFSENKQPVPFSYCIRNNQNRKHLKSSIGFLSILEKETNQHIYMLPGGKEETTITMKISASIQIAMQSYRRVHGWLRHVFSEDTESYVLQANVKQYGSFILLLGTLLEDNQIDCKCACVLHHGQQLEIPLSTTDLPTAKEFSRAISSISEEQQEFSRLFRSMQLEGSLFVVGTIPIQPQLEKVLNLPECSLSKRFELQEQIIGLFVDHQIPGDILRFDGETDLSTEDKIQQVSYNVHTILELVASEVKQEEEQKQEQKLASRELLENFQCKLSSTSMRLERTHQLALETELIGMSTLQLLETQQQQLLDQDARLNEIGKSVSRMRNISCSISAELDYHSDLLQLPQEIPSAPGHSKKVSLLGKLFAQHEEHKYHTGPIKQESTGVVNEENIEEDNKEEDNPINSEHPATSEVHSSIDQHEHSHVNLIQTQQDVFEMRRILENTFESDDVTADAVHSCIIKTSIPWKLSKRGAIDGDDTIAHELQEEEIKSETSRALDLLDLLSRSGTLSLSHVDHHVIMGKSHWFEHSIMETLVQQNLNPLSCLERSAVIFSETLQKGLP